MGSIVLSCSATTEWSWEDGQAGFSGHDGSTRHSFPPRLAVSQLLQDPALGSLTCDIKSQGLGCLLGFSLRHGDQRFLPHDKRSVAQE